MVNERFNSTLFIAMHYNISIIYLFWNKNHTCTTFDTDFIFNIFPIYMFCTALHIGKGSNALKIEVT